MEVRQSDGPGACRDDLTKQPVATGTPGRRRDLVRGRCARTRSATTIGTPSIVRMNEGTLSHRQIRGWVANRFYYQENIPRKGCARSSSNCPDVEVRRRWIRRIVDHDGTVPGEGGIEAWLRLGEAAGLTREEVRDHRHLVPGGAVRRRRLRELRPDPPVGGGGGVLAHRAVRPAT